MTHPLAGIRVLDLTRLLPGGVCTMMLADLGADVVKVEDPNGGDYARWMPPLISGQSAFFHMNNRNKRSLILDLKQAEGQDVFKRLAAKADVMLEGFRPEVMKRLGCDYETLRVINPRLVYCALSGWGADGPYAARSGHDLNYVATAGLTGAMELPQVMGGQIADIGGAYIAVAGILAALLRRERGGAGGFVDASLFEASLPFGLYGWVEALHMGRGGGQGGLTGGAACYNIYRARDGQAISLAALEPKFWNNFCTAVSRPDLIEDYLAPERQGYLRAELEELFALKKADEWQEQLQDKDCCFALVNTPGAAGNDPQVQARGMMGVTPDGIAWMRSPIRLDGAESRMEKAPEYGEHSRQILLEAGYSEDNIDGLLARQVIRE